MKSRGVRVVELPQRFRGARLRIGEVLRQIIHLLDEARAHLVVVLVEPERERLAIQHLVANRRLDERIELLGRRLAALQHRGRGARLRDLLRRDDDRIAAGRDGLAAPSRHREQRGANQQKMHERIFDEPRHASPETEKRPRIMAARAAGHKEERAKKKGPGQRGEGDWPGPYSNRKKPNSLREAQSHELLRVAAAHEQQRRFVAVTRRIQRRHDIGNVVDGLLVDPRDDVAGAQAFLGRSTIRSGPLRRRRRRRRSVGRASRDRHPSAAAARDRAPRCLAQRRRRGSAPQRRRSAPRRARP